MARKKPSQTAKNDVLWRNRIVGTGEESPDQLLANPFNFRVHGAEQRKAMRTMLTGIGWVQNAIVNRVTGHLIDGHMRVEEAMKAGVKVPVVYVELSPDEERAVLAAYDPIGAMASTDHAKMADLIRQIQQGDQTAQELAKAAATKTRTVMENILDDEDINKSHDIAPNDDITGFVYRPTFSSTNEWEIPDTREDMLSDVVPTKVWAGTDNLSERPDGIDDYLFLADRLPGQWNPDGGTLCFYVWDGHFDNLWFDAAQVLANQRKKGWTSVIAPDFSVWRNTPFALALYEIYRQRWVSRFWQEAGFRIVPNLHTTVPAAFPWSIHTLPKKPPVMAMQCRTDNVDDMARNIFLRTVQEGIKVLQPETLVIYGGEENRNWIEPGLPKGPRYIHLSSVANIRLKSNKAKKAAKETAKETS